MTGLRKFRWRCRVVSRSSANRCRFRTSFRKRTTAGRNRRNERRLGASRDSAGCSRGAQCLPFATRRIVRGVSDCRHSSSVRVTSNLLGFLARAFTPRRRAAAPSVSCRRVGLIILPPVAVYSLDAARQVVTQKMSSHYGGASPCPVTRSTCTSWTEIS